MDFTVTALATFSASHQQEEGCPLGARLHGHRYHVNVKIIRRFDPAKGILAPGITTLVWQLHTLLEEINGEHLNQMLPGTNTLAENIGAWVMERLVLEFPSLIEVTITVDDDHAVTVSREVRT